MPQEGGFMAQIKVSNLTFAYEGSSENVFEDLNFQIDTDWKLGFIARNGKGKTTLLRLLINENSGGKNQSNEADGTRERYEYESGGSITASTRFDYFPYPVTQEDLECNGSELIEKWKPQAEYWQVLIQLAQIHMDPEYLERPFKTLSHGERTRIMLAVLFATENEFLLIDEPTNHLDVEARRIVKEYLSSKKGFILVSHDRDLLDGVCDHVLVMNRETVQVQAGNFSSWWENKEKSDAFAMAENEKHLKQIGKLKAAADRSSRWAEKNENTKIGFDPVKEPERNISTRSYIGAKTKKMQSRVKNYEKRIDREISEKEGLLQDIEQVKDLKLNPLKYHKEVLIFARELAMAYENADRTLFEDLRFTLKRGDRVAVTGANGCGKSTLIKAILARAGGYEEAGLDITGTLEVPSGLVISYVNQDTSFLKGSLHDFCKERNLDESLFLAVLRNLDFERTQFTKNMEDFSEGQKKKVLIAGSLITPAHLYIWDEPLNFIDVFSRMQIEKLILDAQPTMLFVEHDVRFCEKVATQSVRL